MICEKCQSDIPEESLFCPKCGTSLYAVNDLDDDSASSKKKTNNKRLIIVLAVIAVFSMAVYGSIRYYIEMNTSPIQGVSKQTYINGMNFLDEIQSDDFQQEMISTMGKVLNDETTWDSFDRKYKEKIKAICTKKKKSEEEEIFVDAIIITYDQYDSAIKGTVFAAAMYSYIGRSSSLNNFINDFDPVKISAEGIAALKSNDINKISGYVNSNHDHLEEIKNQYK